MDALALWTRNPAPLLPLIPEWERRGIRTVWLVTLTGYPAWLEPAVPPPEEALRAIEALSSLVGRERIAWRYDPVFACPARGMDGAYHRENFARLAPRLRNFVRHGVVSLYDDYAKARRKLAAADAPFDPESALAAVRAVAEVAREEGFPLQSCCEELAAEGIPSGGCISGPWLDGLWNLGIGGAADQGQREGCLCAPSVDIGAYGTCRHGCLYCYAAGNAPHTAGDPASESLV